MSRRRPLFAGPFVAALVFGLCAGEGLWAADRPRSGERAPTVVESDLATDGDMGPELADPNFPAEPVESHQVLVDRLVLLGADAVAAEQAMALSLDEGVSLDAVAAQLSLGAQETAKAVDLLRAWQAGEPVSLVGYEPTPELLARVLELMADGMDPDVAAWTSLKEQSLRQLPEPNEAPRTLGAASVDGQEEISLDDLGNGQPGVLAFCRTCPSFDFNLPEPIVTYRYHASSLTSGADCKIYRFAVRAGQTYRFTFCTGGGTAPFDSVLEVFNGSCGAVATNDDSCGIRSQVDLSATWTGYAFVKVTDKNQVGGAYRLAYANITSGSGGCQTCPQFDFGTFTPTDVWQTHSSTIAANGCKIYRFYLQNDFSYRFSLCEGGGTSNFDARLMTNTANCAPGPANDDFCGLNPQVDVITVEATGYVYVKVSGFGSAAGNYTLAYRKIPTPCPACPGYNYTHGAPGTTYVTTGLRSFPAGSTCRVHRFVLTAGKKYRFTVCEGGGAVTGFTARLRLQDTSGACNELYMDQAFCAAGGQITTCAIPTTGHYLLRVEPTVAGAGGTYNIAFRELPDLCQRCPDDNNGGPAFVPGNTYTDITQTMESWETCRTYKFMLTGGARYRFTLCDDLMVNTPPSPTLALSLLPSPACMPAAAGPTSMGCAPTTGRINDFIPPADGVYDLVIEPPICNLVGPYNFTLRYVRLAQAPCGVDGNLTPSLVYQTAAEGQLPSGGTRTYGLILNPDVDYRFTLCDNSMAPHFEMPTGSAPATDSRMEFFYGAPPCGTTTLVYDDQCGDDADTAVFYGGPAVRQYLLVVDAKNTWTNGYRGHTMAYAEIGRRCDAPPYQSLAEPTVAWQTVAPVAPGEGTVLRGGNRTYTFTVTPGTTYFFSTCAADGDGSVTGFDSAIAVRNAADCTVITPTTTTACGDDENVEIVAPPGVTSLHVTVATTAASSGTLNLKHRRMAVVTPCTTPTVLAAGALGEFDLGWKRVPTTAPAIGGCGPTGPQMRSLAAGAQDIIRIPLFQSPIPAFHHDRLSIAFCSEGIIVGPRACVDAAPTDAVFPFTPDGSIVVEVWTSDNTFAPCTMVALPGASISGACPATRPRYNDINVAGATFAFVVVRFPPGVAGNYSLAYATSFIP